MLVAVLLAFLAVGAVLAWVALAQPGPLWRKCVALLALVLSVPVALVAVHELTGRPKPLALEWIHDLHDGATVIAYHFVEDEAIYLWLVLPGETMPRAYALPWDRKAAKALEEADSVAQQLHSDMEMTLEDDPDHVADFTIDFHALVIPTLQDKPVEEDNSFDYDRDAGE